MPTDSSGPIAWLAARLTVVLALNSMVGVDGSPAPDSALTLSLLVAGWGGAVSATLSATPFGLSRGDAPAGDSGGGRRRRCVAARAAGTSNQIMPTLGCTWAALTRLDDECHHHGGPRLYNVEPVGPVGLL